MNTLASTTQADFLSNHHNKERLITLFFRHLETAGIEVCNSEGDADTLIVKRALELASLGNNVTVVASDTDIAVMLLARATDDMQLRVLSPGIGESKDCVLFCHAVTGCDTTSAFFGNSKKKAWKFLPRSDMRNVTIVFSSPESTKQEVCAAGETFYIALYGGINVESLDELKWKLAGGFLVPILTSQAPAPESLLRLVSCGYKTDCGYRCECRRAGLACSTMCGHCRGGSHMNIKIQDFHGSDDEDDPEQANL
ncbi:hypothetical protein PR048_014197 [Dryococelus australis]|uniref:NYN domain-containing protein n=1 Tax=Dryococelus australis TaxID=614101 RepID=A0ABQ9HDG4_9NEOP|nr:hypothetical protein PR048_014197 [Dryococelus australis]